MEVEKKSASEDQKDLIKLTTLTLIILVLMTLFYIG